jgi:uncharacterized protein (DUF58 family)
MVISGRGVGVVAVLALLVVLRPQWSTLWLYVLVVVLVVAVDALRAASPSRIAVERDGDSAVRVGDQATLRLRLTNRSARRFTGTVRSRRWPHPHDGADAMPTR